MITSFSNPTVKRAKALADRKARRREGAWVVEGLQPVWRAVTSDWPIETLIVAPELLTNDAARAMVARQADAGVRVTEVSREILVRLSGRDGPAGLMAIVRGVIGTLDSFAPRPGTAILALDTPGNPGNIGTLIRTADAAGIGGVVVAGPAADPLAPAAVKASMGSIFAVPVARAADTDELLAWAQQRRRPVIAVTGHTERTLWTAPLPAECVLLLGSEGGGLPAEVVDRCAGAVAIPMEGTAESLNLAAAGTLAMYEVKRRRDLAEQR